MIPLMHRYLSLESFGDSSTSIATNPTHTYTIKGDFNVKLTASRTNSCIVSITKDDLVIIQDNSYIFIPTVFTPNGDGINDYFHVTITNCKSYSIQVFTRWGAPIFQSQDVMASWNGTYGGKQAPMGVYYWVINAVSTDGEAINKSGYVTVVR